MLRVERNVEAHLRHFELSLLAALGYGIAFDIEADSDSPIRADTLYHFVAGEGFHRQASASQYSIPGAIVKAIDNGDWQTPEVLRGLKSITQTALNEQLHGVTLRSRQYFRSQKVSVKD